MRKTKRKNVAMKNAPRPGRIRNIRAMAAGGTPEWTEEMRELYKPIKKSVTLRLDADVLAWFKQQGRGYQTRINRALRGLMTEKMPRNRKR